MIEKKKKTNNEKAFIACLVLLISLTLFTAVQIYYSVFIHLAIFLVCYLVCAKEQKRTTAFVSTGIVLCVVFCMMSLMKGYGLAMEHFGLFLHYITWPVLFIFVVHKFSPEEKRKLLIFIVAICIIGDILSLIQLAQNPDASRWLAGAEYVSSAEKNRLLRFGVGSYGYVFGMAFVTFGAVRWLKVTRIKKEKALLILFLIVNFLFIVQASYTIAIVLTLIMIGAAMIAGMKSVSRILIIVMVIVLIIVFAVPILQFGYNLAKDLELPWVVKRLGQVLEAIEKDDASSLKRYELYKESWDTFALRPVFGAILDKGDTWGGHSQMLDTMAQYGLFAALLPAFLVYCKKMCCRHIPNFAMTIFYLAFAVFVIIDTCTAMQLPVILFFVVPMIAHMESEGFLAGTETSLAQNSEQT